MSDFEILPVLEDMIPDGALIHKHLPRQADIDRIMIQINRKYLKKMHLPCSLKDMQAAYMQSREVTTSNDGPIYGPGRFAIYLFEEQSWGT